MKKLLKGDEVAYGDFLKMYWDDYVLDFLKLSYIDSSSGCQPLQPH